MGNLINRQMVFHLVRLGPVVGCQGFSVNGSYRGSDLRKELIQDLDWYITRDTACFLNLLKSFIDFMVF